MYMLGNINIVHQLKNAYKITNTIKSEQNQKIIPKIIDCVIFCGKFELPLHNHYGSSVITFIK